MSRASIKFCSIFFPLKFIKFRAKAASVVVIKVPSVFIKDTKTVFTKYLANGAAFIASAKFDSCGTAGINFGGIDVTSPKVIKADEIIYRNGNRVTAAIISINIKARPFRILRISYLANFLMIALCTKVSIKRNKRSEEHTSE